MELSDFYPDPKDLIASELKILNYLRNDPFITERHSQFAQDASMYYGRNQRDDSGFEFFLRGRDVSTYLFAVTGGGEEVLSLGRRLADAAGPGLVGAGP